MPLPIEEFVRRNMRKGRILPPARLQAALALVEKLRQDPSLDLDDHMARPGSSGLKSHELWGARAHTRLNLHTLNTTHGRRSSSLRDWGQQLLDLLAGTGFANATPEERDALISSAQEQIANVLREIVEQDPLEAHVSGRSAEAVIHEVLRQAEDKGKAGDVAQYLVGAKLVLRFGQHIPVHQANRPDRKSRADDDARLGDFEIENAVIEVAVGLPDEKHLSQIAETLENSDMEVWLLTRADRVATWKSELDFVDVAAARRVVVTSVEAFVGQNITELGEFSSKGKAAQLGALFEIYNTQWVARVGTPGIRIVARGR